MIYSDTENLRKDAIARAKEMYGRAPKKDGHIQPEKKELTEQKKEFPSAQNILGENADRVLLLIIIYLLYKEKADFKILIALLYIFL